MPRSARLQPAASLSPTAPSNLVKTARSHGHHQVAIAGVPSREPEPTARVSPLEPPTTRAPSSSQPGWCALALVALCWASAALAQLAPQCDEARLRVAGSLAEPWREPTTRLCEMLASMDDADAVDAAERAHGEDSAYLRVIDLLRRGRVDDARRAAQSYLSSYPDGFRRPEVSRLVEELGTGAGMAPPVR
jgi:hypothetical protein